MRLNIYTLIFLIVNYTSNISFIIVGFIFRANENECAIPFNIITLVNGFIGLLITIIINFIRINKYF